MLARAEAAVLMSATSAEPESTMRHPHPRFGWLKMAWALWGAARVVQPVCRAPAYGWRLSSSVELARHEVP
eukprot:2608202-Alexandrium_andersonii.AAC.1